MAEVKVSAAGILFDMDGVLVSSIGEADIQTLIRSPHVCVGSDGNCVAPYGITGQGMPHPRFYGTFPRILGHYVRDLGLVPGWPPPPAP